ncbi:MAG: ATPase domain-containing protein [Gemmatimonadaceae bacterium]
MSDTGEDAAPRSALNSSSASPSPVTRRAATGVKGLDDLLYGGLPRDRVYLIDGEPGSGKTTLALQFLLTGRDLGERGLYVTLSETADELRAIAASHGWSLDGVEIFELPGSDDEAMNEAYTLFHPAEVELQQTVGAVFEEVEKNGAKRVAFDSLSEMRMLAHDPLRFRRQILALKQFFSGRDCTVLVLDDRTGPEGDVQLQSIAHGVILLEHSTRSVGGERRSVVVKKLRGAQYRGGYHDFRIRRGGLEVYPRLPHIGARAAERALEAQDQRMSSGSAEMDALLGGGLTRGTSVLLTGAAGTGKSVLSMQIAHAAAEHGDRVMFFLFDERIPTAVIRARGLGMDIEGAVKSGRLTLQQIEPTEISPGEFASRVASAVDQDDVKLVVLDSLNGFMHSMPDDRQLAVQVHELISYLSGRGVTILMTLVQRGIFGAPVDEMADVSYLADTVLLLRYFEFAGAVRQAVSVVKMRSGAHERTIRECRVARGGMHVGAPLEEFQGVLTGVPTYRGELGPLLSAHAIADVPAPLPAAVREFADTQKSRGAAEA